MFAGHSMLCPYEEKTDLGRSGCTAGGATAKADLRQKQSAGNVVEEDALL
jgi:hypothetical protein